MVSLWENKHCGEAPFPKLSAVRRKSRQKRSPVQVKAFLPWLQYLCQPYALGTRTLSWFGHGCSGNRMLSEHERYHGLGMDALQQYALRKRTLSWLGHGRSGNRMLLEHERYHGLCMDALAAVCSSCLLCCHPDKMPRSCRCFHIGSQVQGGRQSEQVSAARPTWRCNPLQSCSRAADIPKCAFYQGALVAHLPRTSTMDGSTEPNQSPPPLRTTASPRRSKWPWLHQPSPPMRQKECATARKAAKQHGFTHQQDRGDTGTHSP